MSNKLFIALGVCAAAAAGAAWYLARMAAPALPFESICEPEHKRFTPLCQNLGMRAGSLPDMSALTDKDYGEIVGVAWRNKGNVINRPGETARFSETNDYYYIICPDETPETCFLRLTSEVQPREVAPPSQHHEGAEEEDQGQD